jgi:hypothetical protein
VRTGRWESLLYFDQDLTGKRSTYTPTMIFLQNGQTKAKMDPFASQASPHFRESKLNKTHAPPFLKKI